MNISWGLDPQNRGEKDSLLHTFFFKRTSNFIWGSSVLRFLRSQHGKNKAFVLKIHCFSYFSYFSYTNVLINCVLIKKKVCITALYFYNWMLVNDKNYQETLKGTRDPSHVNKLPSQRPLMDFSQPSTGPTLIISSLNKEIKFPNACAPILRQTLSDVRSWKLKCVGHQKGVSNSNFDFYTGDKRLN